MTNYDVESHRHGTEKCFTSYFWHPTYARTTRYEDAFLPEGKKRPRSLRSLGLASLLIGAVKKARSVRSFAARFNLTNDPYRSSLIQLYFRFVHVDGSTSTSTSEFESRTKGRGRISDKRKTYVS